MNSAADGLSEPLYSFVNILVAKLLHLLSGQRPVMRM